MRLIENKTFDQERALYGEHSLHLVQCIFDGPADGESALKECRDIQAERLLCNLRYPFWHDSGLKISQSELTEHCRAALWYSDHIEITGSKLHGIKALRECSDVRMADCDIRSAEFGWSLQRAELIRCVAAGEYFLLRAEEMHLSGLHLQGKYSFQYIKNATIDACDLDTKDAFWHAQNVTVRNSVIKGEYLAWYSDGLTLINCKITGTQPFCYCKNLTLVDCEMIGTDLSFEKSHVNATVLTPVDSIKNPASGTIRAPSVGKIILDDPAAKGKILVGAPVGSEETSADS